MRTYRILIVDDEPAAREGTRLMLEHDAELVVVGELGNGADAAAAIIDDAPDIVLLDVQMPDLDGFECLDLLDPVARPEVVFLTAHEEYAVRAFAVAATDYVLKPFSEARLAEALGRAKERVRARGSQRRRLTRIVARVGATLHVIPVDEIDWIEGADYYARVHRGTSSFLVRQSLARLESQLDADTFLRIHRSTIVNVERVVQVIGGPEPAVALASGTWLPVSRRLRGKVEDFLRERA